MDVSLLSPAWRDSLAETLATESARKLAEFLEDERENDTVYPAARDVFAALEHTSPPEIKVVLLGQDPYHGPGQAHGLCFSVPVGIRFPPSLRNVFKELEADVGCAIPADGCLLRWAKQGVLLLNTVLTVRAGQAGSHRKRGWEDITDRVIRIAADSSERVVFLLWGKHAQAKKPLIDESRHAVIESAHPSPLSAHNGFLGSRPFSRANESLRAAGRAEISWCLS